MTICTTCGSVLSETADLTYETSFHDEAVRSVTYASTLLTHTDRCKLRLKLDLQALLTSFNLNLSLSDRIMALLEHVVKARLCTYGSRRARLFGLAAFYLLVRGERKPITLFDLGAAWQVDAWQIASCVRPLCDSLSEDIAMLPDDSRIPVDPVLFVERHWQTIKGRFFEIQDERPILSMAVALTDLVRQSWMRTGRRAEPISMACLLIAVATKSEEDILTREALRDILDNAGDVNYPWSFSPRTVEERVREVLAVLYADAQRLLPWFGNSDASSIPSKDNQGGRKKGRESYEMPIWKTVVPVISDVLRYRSLLESGSPSGSLHKDAQDLPEAFKKSQDSRAERVLLLAAARQHLQSLISGAPCYVELTRDVVDIERLLLHGIPNDDIVDLSQKRIRELAGSVTELEMATEPGVDHFLDTL